MAQTGLELPKQNLFENAKAWWNNASRETKVAISSAFLLVILPACGGIVALANSSRGGGESGGSVPAAAPAKIEEPSGERIPGTFADMQQGFASGTATAVAKETKTLEPKPTKTSTPTDAPKPTATPKPPETATPNATATITSIANATAVVKTEVTTISRESISGTIKLSVSIDQSYARKEGEIKPYTDHLNNVDTVQKFANLIEEIIQKAKKTGDLKSTDRLTFNIQLLPDLDKISADTSLGKLVYNPRTNGSSGPEVARIYFDEKTGALTIKIDMRYDKPDISGTYMAPASVTVYRTGLTDYPDKAEKGIASSDVQKFLKDTKSLFNLN